MLNKMLLVCVGLVFASGTVLAGADGDLSKPSTTGNAAMEQPTSDMRDAGSGERNGMNDRAGDVGEESALGTMGAGSTGTTGGMGATTGTDTIESRNDETDQ